MVTYGSTYEKKDTREKHEDECEKKEKHQKNSECPPTQTHTHEYQASTEVIPEEDNEEFHNHRFAGVTSEVMFVPGGHVHTFGGNTDFFDHHHEAAGTTELPSPLVGDGDKHVHFAKGTTTFDDCHDHQFQFATLIQQPIVFDEE
jgi:hypothetical protein